MNDPLTLQRMALRIERLMHTPTHDWHPADELSFKQHMPARHAHAHPRRLPDPATLRGPSTTPPSPATVQIWNAVLLDMESLVHRNDPRNPRRILHDMARGRRTLLG